MRRRSRKIRQTSVTRKVSVMGRGVLVVFIFMAILLVGTVYLAIESASKGAYLMNVEDEVAIAVERNEDLKNRLITQTSLSEVTEEANEMGMQKAESFVYLDKVEPVAKIP